MLRVIAGEARGIPLKTLRGPAVRPTMDRVREATFNILAPRIPGSRFADLFAGSGANGIEALSRGAACCVFVDDNPNCLAVIRENLEKARFSDRATLRRLTLPQHLVSLTSSGFPFDLIYADPPFDFKDYHRLIAQIIELKLLSNDGRLVVEHRRQVRLPECFQPLKLADRRTYGTVSVSFFT